MIKNVIKSAAFPPFFPFPSVRFVYMHAVLYSRHSGRNTATSREGKKNDLLERVSTESNTLDRNPESISMVFGSVLDWTAG